jgi:hypothetical protein
MSGNSTPNFGSNDEGPPKGTAEYYAKKMRMASKAKANVAAAEEFMRRVKALEANTTRRYSNVNPNTAKNIQNAAKAAARVAKSAAASAAAIASVARSNNKAAKEAERAASRAATTARNAARKAANYAHHPPAGSPVNATKRSNRLQELREQMKRHANLRARASGVRTRRNNRK